MSITEAAERLGIGPAVLYKLVAERRISCRRQGIAKGRIRFTESDLEEWQAAQRVPREAPAPPKGSQAEREAEREFLGLPRGGGRYTQ